MLEQTVNAARSYEYLIWRHLKRIQQHYLAFTNATTWIDSKEALKSFKTATTDLEKVVRELLYNAGCPNALILNVSDRALRLWTLGVMDGLWANANQYYQRYLYAKGQAHKLSELTAFYYLVKELAECSLEVKAEDYYGGAHELRRE